MVWFITFFALAGIVMVVYTTANFKARFWILWWLIAAVFFAVVALLFGPGMGALIAGLWLLCPIVYGYRP